jgi:hypothetical protein
MHQKRFKARLGSDAGALFVQVPFDVKKAFGRARAPVNVTVNGYTYQSTISVYAGKYYVPVRNERREAACVTVGDIVDVTLASDTAIRTLKPPRDLWVALAQNGLARAHWDRLSYSHKKELVDAIVGAKKSETRAHRLHKILKNLTAKTG